MKKVRFGVIGVGPWGELHARALSRCPDAELMAVCDLNESRARMVVSNTGARLYYSNYESLLADDSIDAVCIATPDHLHLEIASAAARAGKHMLVEKPLATTVDEAEIIAELARESKVKLMVNFHHRWHPALWGARESIQAGRIGTPHLLALRWNHRIDLPTRGILWTAQSSVAWYAGSHAVDAARWLTHDEVVRVYAASATKVLDSLQVPTPDFFTAILEFAQGAVATIETCWSLPHSAPSANDIRGQVVGTEGVVYFDEGHHRMLECYERPNAAQVTQWPDVTEAPTVHGQPVGHALESVRAFATALARDEPLPISPEDGLAAARIVAAIHQSARTKQPVLVEQPESAPGRKWEVATLGAVAP
jgi:predicted dehydrogenase